MVVSNNEWFIRQNPIRMDDLGVPLFKETSMYVIEKLLMTGFPVRNGHFQPLGAWIQQRSLTASAWA